MYWPDEVRDSQSYLRMIDFSNVTSFIFFSILSNLTLIFTPPPSPSIDIFLYPNLK